MSVTLTEYQQAERELTMREATRGLQVHAIVAVLLCVVVVLINLFLAKGYPWSVFVIAGTAVGLFFHWFGYRNTERNLSRHQHQVERHASSLVEQ